LRLGRPSTWIAVGSAPSQNQPAQFGVFRLKPCDLGFEPSTVATDQLLHAPFRYETEFRRDGFRAQSRLAQCPTFQAELIIQVRPRFDPVVPHDASDSAFEAAMQLLDCAFEQAKFTAGYL